MLLFNDHAHDGKRDSSCPTAAMVIPFMPTFAMTPMALAKTLTAPGTLASTQQHTHSQLHSNIAVSASAAVACIDQVGEHPSGEIQNRNMTGELSSYTCGINIDGVLGISKAALLRDG